jgi:hypothetical protein
MAARLTAQGRAGYNRSFRGGPQITHGWGRRGLLSAPDGNASPPLNRGLMKRFHAVPTSEERYGLGEGPFWDGDRNRVLWVDINAGAVHSGTLSAQHVTHDTMLRLPETVGAVVASRDGELLVAGARRLYNVSPKGAVSGGPPILPEGIASRLNDGGCDPAGRFLVGSLALDDRAYEEVLVRVDADGQILVLDDDLGRRMAWRSRPGGTSSTPSTPGPGSSGGATTTPPPVPSVAGARACVWTATSRTGSALTIRETSGSPCGEPDRCAATPRRENSSRSSRWRRRTRQASPSLGRLLTRS